MNFKQLAILSACLALLAGCGGGGGSGPGTTAASDSSTTVSGVAATGAAFTGATVTVTDSTGAVVGTSSVPVDDDGTYSVTLAAGAKPPFIIVASRPNSTGLLDSLVSVLDSASTATVNVTPITTLIASRLSPSGDPLKLAAEVAAGQAEVSSSLVAAKVEEVLEILKPILAATDTATFDPLKGSFVADGTGYDRMLDSIKISFTPSGAASTNVEVGVKVIAAADAQPPVIAFSSGQTLDTIKTNNQITDTAIGATPISSNVLVTPGTTALIADLLNRINACLALPLDQRVNNTNLATATTANIAAPACRTLFQGDDPANYLQGGTRVGPNGALSGIFRDTGTNLVYDQGTYEFSRPNGDVVLGFRTTDPKGNSTNDAMVATMEGGKLKLVGNQYRLGGTVVAYHQLRTFVNQPASTYYSTGYNFNIPLQNYNGQPVVKVVVTTPRGTTITLLRGSDGMVLPRQNLDRSLVQPLAGSGTSFLRIRSEYADVNSTAAHPLSREAGLFGLPTDDSEEAIAKTPAQSAWKLAYFTNAAATTPDVEQIVKTRARALTIAELRTRKMAELNADTLNGITSMSQTSTTGDKFLSLAGEPSIIIGWTVPGGALPVTSIRAFGHTRNTTTTPVTNTQFQDFANVPSTAREGTILCQNGNAETHCATNGAYVDNAFLTGVHLWARDASGREFVNFNAINILP